MFYNEHLEHEKESSRKTFFTKSNFTKSKYFLNFFLPYREIFFESAILIKSVNLC